MKKDKNLFRMKELRLAEKNHKGVSDLLERFDFKDENDLFETIRQINPPEADELIKMLKKNQKQSEKKQAQVNAVSIDQSTEEPQVEADKENVEQSKLETLVEEKEKILSELSILKVQSSESSIKKAKLQEDVIGRKYILKVLRRELEEQEAIIAQKEDEIEKMKEHLLGVNAEIDARMELLEEIENEIESSKKVHVLIHPDGSFAISNIEEEILVPEEDDFKLLAQIIKKASGELTINEIKNIVSSKKAIEALEKKGIIFDLEFEDSKIEKLFF